LQERSKTAAPTGRGLRKKLIARGGEPKGGAPRPFKKKGAGENWIPGAAGVSKMDPLYGEREKTLTVQEKGDAWSPPRKRGLLFLEKCRDGKKRV